MFQLTAAHLDAFAECQKAAFVEELALASYDTLPDDGPFLNRQARLTGAELVFRNAANGGYSTRGGLFFWLNLAGLLGSHFHSDPQYKELRPPQQPLDDPQELTRLSRTYREISAYISEVHGGPSNHIYTKAGRALSDRLKSGALGKQSISPLEEMHTMYPQKVVRHRNLYLHNFNSGFYAAKAAKVLKSEHPGDVLFVACLEMMFGHRFEIDAFKPWIGETLDICAANAPGTRPHLDPFIVLFDAWIDPKD